MLRLIAFLFSVTTLTATAKTNVLFIAVDDLANVLASAGSSPALTPNLDRLAARGVRFDRAYCQIPLCNPSRASILTGMRPDVTTVYDLDRHFRDQVSDVITLPQLFKQNGWFTARVGKIYHYDVPKGIGTDGLDDAASWQQVINPKGRDIADEALITNPLPERPISAAMCWLAADGTDEEQTDGMIASEAVRLLEQHQNEAFFLGVGFFRPHTPYVAPKKYFEMYPLEKVRLPTAPANDRDDIPPAAFAHNCPIPNYGLPTETCREALRAYLACVTFVDAQIGRVIDALDRLNLTANTIIVFWSDHGYHLGEHLGAWQKRNLFEESARAPLMIVAPKAAGNGQASKAIVEFTDIYPTLADLCGLQAPATATGRSLRPLLAAPTKNWKGHAFTQILRPGDDSPFVGRSVRTDRWRYTEWDGGKQGAELYDHDNDPREFTNLAQDPAQAANIAELRTFLDAAIRSTPPATPVTVKRL